MGPVQPCRWPRNWGWFVTVAKRDQLCYCSLWPSFHGYVLSITLNYYTFYSSLYRIILTIDITPSLNQSLNRTVSFKWKKQPEEYRGGKNGKTVVFCTYAGRIVLWKWHDNVFLEYFESFRVTQYTGQCEILHLYCIIHKILISGVPSQPGKLLNFPPCSMRNSEFGKQRCACFCVPFLLARYSVSKTVSRVLFLACSFHVFLFYVFKNPSRKFFIITTRTISTCRCQESTSSTPRSNSRESCRV